MPKITELIYGSTESYRLPKMRELRSGSTERSGNLPKITELIYGSTELSIA